MNPDRPGASPSGSHGHPAVPWLRIASYVLASRVFIYVFANLSVYALTKGPADRMRAPLSLDLFKRWDSDWYLGVARHGYQVTAHGTPSTAFFPLYPLLVRLAGVLCHDLRVAGYLVSNACLFGGCVMLWKIAARDSTRENVGDRAVLFFLFNPVAFFYSTIYSESLFFLLMTTLAWFATERRWLVAGACGFLASLTRPVGVLLISLLVAEFFAPYLTRRRDKSDEASPWPDRQAPAFLASLVMSVAGLGVYCLCLAHRFGDPFAFMKAEAAWHRHFTVPWAPFTYLYTAFYSVWFDAATVIGLVALAIGFLVRIRLSYLAMCCTYFLMYISTNRLEAIPRFLSVLFPFYLVIALMAARYPRLEPFLLAGSVMLLTLSTILFVNGYWYTG